MRILINAKVKALFGQMVFWILAFSLVSAVFLDKDTAGRGYLHVLVPLTMGIAVLAVCYRYFREQDRILEDAVVKIQEYMAGNRDVRIECNEEGELYRLFHEVNSLAAILNAKAVNEG